jgi:hypothetical protein
MQSSIELRLSLPIPEKYTCELGSSCSFSWASFSSWCTTERARSSLLPLGRSCGSWCAVIPCDGTHLESQNCQDCNSWPTEYFNTCCVWSGQHTRHTRRAAYVFGLHLVGKGETQYCMGHPGVCCMRCMPAVVLPERIQGAATWCP